MRVFRFLTLMFVLLLIVITIANNLEIAPGLFKWVYSFPLGDKIAHFILMGTLAMLTSLGFSTSRVRLFGLPLLKGSLVIAVLVTIEEASQVFLDSRDASLFDLLANYAGIFFLGEFGALLRWLFSAQKVE